MMGFTTDITVDDCIGALGDFLQPFLVVSKGISPDPDVLAEIIRGNVNRTPMPQGAFARLTESHQSLIAWTSATHNSVDQTVTFKGQRQLDVQVDLYGEMSGDWAQMVATVSRTGYPSQIFSQYSEIEYLYCNDPFQGALIDAEMQYQNRWVLTCFLQYNPSVTLPEQSALALHIKTEMLK